MHKQCTCQVAHKFAFSSPGKVCALARHRHSIVEREKKNVSPLMPYSMRHALQSKCRPSVVAMCVAHGAFAVSLYSVPGSDDSLKTSCAHLMMAEATAGTTALPNAMMPMRLPVGSSHSGGKPCSTAVSRTVRHLMVLPSEWHHVNGWLAV